MPVKSSAKYCSLTHFHIPLNPFNRHKIPQNVVGAITIANKTFIVIRMSIIALQLSRINIAAQFDELYLSLRALKYIRILREFLAHNFNKIQFHSRNSYEYLIIDT